MLQKLRDQTQSLAFRVLVGVIIFVLAIFGFGAFNLFLTTDPSVASVNGDDITESMLAVESERERRRLAAQFGEEFNPDLIDPIALQNSVINQLVARLLLTQAVDDMEIGTSDTRTNATVVGNPLFQIDGRFEEANYRRMVSMLGFSPQEFLARTGDLLAIDQLRGSIVDSAFTTEWELRQHARLLNQRRDIAYLAFTQENFAAGINVEDDEIALRYEENQLDFMTEESLDVAFVELNVDQLGTDESIQIDEEELIAAYEADKAVSSLEEQRDSRHILLQINDQRTEEEALFEIAVLRARIESGEDFAAVAEEASEDPGSAAQGGELGPVGKGSFAPEFEEALWALESGELSAPVLTDFGYHLIQLNDIVINEYPVFAELRDQIEEQLRRDEAARLFLDQVRELDNLAFEQPDSLQGLSDQFGLEIQAAEGITRTTGSGIFGNVMLRESVFTDEVLSDGYNSPAVEYLEGRAVVARIVEHHEPEAIPLEDVSEQVRAEIVAERARVEIDQAHAAALARVEAGESVAQVADEFGLSWQTRELARRNDPTVPQAVLAASFKLTRPLDGNKRVDSVEGPAGERYLITLTRVEDGDVLTMTEAEIGGVRQFLAQRAPNLDFEGFYSALEEDASVQRP